MLVQLHTPGWKEDFHTTKLSEISKMFRYLKSMRIDIMCSLLPHKVDNFGENAVVRRVKLSGMIDRLHSNQKI